MSREVLSIDYPKNAEGKKEWNRRYGTNAYWSGKHHAARAKDAQYWHELTWAAMAKAQCRKHPFEKPVVITFLWNDNLDLDNHSMMAKMIVDALKPRVIANDSRKYVQGIEHYWHEHPCIKIIIQEVER